jgi:hypothetical protein
LNDPDRQRDVRRAELESYAEQLERAGRDLCVFGLLTDIYVAFGRPDLPDELLHAGFMFGAVGPLICLVTLFIGFRLREKASRLR